MLARCLSARLLGRAGARRRPRSAFPPPPPPPPLVLVRAEPPRGKGFGGAPGDTPADALLHTSSEVSERTGREAQTRNMVMGDGGNANLSWEELDAKVNEYPMQREFKAIGPAGDDGAGEDLVASLTAAVAGVVGDVDPAAVSTRPSSGGKYVAFTVRLTMESGQQVQDVYAALKADKRVKWVM